MGFLYEPGPLEPLDPSLAPEVEVTTDNETVVAPSVATFFAASNATATIVSQAHGAGVPDYNGETASTLRPAVDELGYQLSTEHELTLGPAISAVVASMNEAGGISADLPAEDSYFEAGPVPGEGTPEEFVEGPPETPGGPPETPIN